MRDAIKVFFLVVSALFPIVDPLSASPIFLALTQNLLPGTRKELSWRVTLSSFVLMVASSRCDHLSVGVRESPLQCSIPHRLRHAFPICLNNELIRDSRPRGYPTQSEQDVVSGFRFGRAHSNS
jgi:hypothetical protein